MTQTLRWPVDWREFGWKSKRPFASLYPEKHRIFNGRTDETGDMYVYAGGTGTTTLTRVSGGADPVPETGAYVVKLSTDETSTDRYCGFNLPANTKVLGEAWWRVRSPDWTAFDSLSLYLSKNATYGINDSHRLDLIWGLGTSDWLNLRNNPWPADTWRWVCSDRSLYVDASGSTEAWGTADDNAWKTVRSLGFKVRAAAGKTAVLYLDRVEGPVWPCPFVNIQLEALYVGAQNYIATPLWRWGKKFSATMNGWVGLVGGEPPDIYPAPADFLTWANRGADISVHARKIDASQFAGCPQQDAEDGVTYWATKCANAIGTPQIDFRHFIYSFLGSDPSVAGYDPANAATGTAGAMRQVGAVAFAGFGSASDPVFGWKSPKGSLTLPAGSTTVMSLIPNHGPYNYSYTGLEHGSGDWATFAPYLRMAMRLRLCWSVFIHNVVTTPGSTDMSIDSANAMIADLKAYASDAEFVSMRDRWTLTYGRPGDLYVNGLNEWKSRRDSGLIL